MDEAPGLDNRGPHHFVDAKPKGAAIALWWRNYGTAKYPDGMGLALWPHQHSSRIQRVFEDVYLHASHGYPHIPADLIFEPYQVSPRFICGVRLYRPYLERQAPEAFQESLDVTYWQPLRKSAGLFCIKPQEPYTKDWEVGALQPHPLLVSEILTKARFLWMMRGKDERDKRSTERAIDSDWGR